MENNQPNKKIAIKTIQDPQTENKYYHNKGPKNRLYFNSVTGEEINLDYENEEDMYYVIPNVGEYDDDKVSKLTDLNEKDKLFFTLWNNFMDKVEKEENYENILIDFLKNNYSYLFEHNLKKNFEFHVILVFENKQIDEQSLININNLLDDLFSKYEKQSKK